MPPLRENSSISSYTGHITIDHRVTPLWLLGDHLGSTSRVANYDGSSRSQLLYKAWGETRFDQGVTPTTFRYTGQREEASLGLYYYGARWYDPALGRFIQADTVVSHPLNSQSWDRYAYVLNNPVIYTDPSGHIACSDTEFEGNCSDGSSWEDNNVRPDLVPISGCPLEPGSPFCQIWTRYWDMLKGILRSLGFDPIKFLSAYLSNIPSSIGTWATFTRDEMLKIGNWLSTISTVLTSLSILAAAALLIPLALWLFIESRNFDAAADFFLEIGKAMESDDIVAVTIVADDFFIYWLSADGYTYTEGIYSPLAKFVVGTIILASQIKQDKKWEDAP